METLAVIGLVGNIVQFVDFSGKLVSKSAELYRSSEGALAENSDIETAINHLVLINNKLKDAATTTGDSALQSLCKSCGTTADQLLAVLDKVKVKGKQDKWKSIRKALRSVWSKEEIEELGRRLERFRGELNLHLTVDIRWVWMLLRIGYANKNLLCREEVRQFTREGSNRLKDLDITTKRIVDAIIKQEDVFRVAHYTQITLMGAIHEETVSKIQDEHAITRREIIQEIRVGSLSRVNTILLNSGQRHEQDMSAANQELCLTTSRKACWYVPLARNKKFVGRSAQLNELEANLFTEGHCPKFAIIGLGGVGKTQIALELAYRIREKHPDCSVFWVPATSAENLQQAYVEVGQQLRIIGLEEKKEDIKKLVQHHLSQESAGQWLLILDNADDMDMWFKKSDINTNTTRLIDYLPRSSKGSIVFTTRSRKAAVKFADRNVIQVTEMDKDAATQVLRNSLINKEILNDHAVVQLLRQLTFLPLAIVQAAAYINENDISLAEYLSLLDDREENIVEVFSEDFEDEGRYHDIKNPIATTWLISFEQIRIRDSLAADYLSFMSCIDPKAIPLSLLPPAQSKKKIVDAIGTLSAYSFITKRPDDQSLDIHRLVHLATRNWLRAQNSLSEWIAKAIAQLADVFPNDNHENRILWRTYLPHAQYVYASDLFKENFKGSLLLLQKFGLCLLSDGRWDEAEQPFMQVMKASARVLGQEHPDTLASMVDLASTFWNQGRWKEAEELDVQVMETRKRVLGQEHPDTLTSMANLASTYRNQGRWKEAEELDVQVMETSLRVLGQEHPSTLTSMANLASTFWNQGRWKEAEELDVQVMETRKRVLGRSILPR
jgi:tetratricopeptide (TPR) repeat protein